MSTFFVDLVTGHIFGVDLPSLGGAAPPVVDTPVSVLGARLVAMIWAPWENGQHPASLIARAQNSSLVDGDTINTLTEWTGNSAHLVNEPGMAGAEWRALHVDGYDLYDFDDQSYRQTPAIVLSNNTTFYVVHESDAARSGYLITGSSSSFPRIDTQTDNTIDLYDFNKFSIGNGTGGGLNQTIIHHDPIAPVTKNIVDGYVVGSTASNKDYSTDTLHSYGSSSFGSSKPQTGVVGYFILQDGTFDDLAYLDFWVALQSPKTIPGAPIASWDFRDPELLFSDIGKTTASVLDGAVAVIADKTGSNDWVQSTGSAQAVRMIGGVYTDGVDDYYVSDALSASCAGGYTMAFSFVWRGDSNCLWSFHDPAGVNRGMLWVGSSKLRWFYSTSSSSLYGTTVLKIGRRYCAIVTVNAAGDCIIYMDGVTEITVTTGVTVLPVDPGQFSLAQEWDGGSPSNEFQALYRRGAVYDTVLDSTDRTALTEWLGIV